MVSVSLVYKQTQTPQQQLNVTRGPLHRGLCALQTGRRLFARARLRDAPLRICERLETELRSSLLGGGVGGFLASCGLGFHFRLPKNRCGPNGGQLTDSKLSRARAPKSGSTVSAHAIKPRI